MPRFKLTGTIIRVVDNKFMLKVDDHCCRALAAIKESIRDPNTTGHFLSVNFKRARFDIKNLEWNEPCDLIGVSVTVTCDHHQRNIRQTIDVPPDGVKNIPDYIYKNVISYSAITIQNNQ